MPLPPDRRRYAASGRIISTWIIAIIAFAAGMLAGSSLVAGLVLLALQSPP